MGILGVISALTLPAIVQKYREQATVARVKKFYSVFSQAYTMAVMENGTIDTWGLENSTMYEDDDGNSLHTDASLEQYDKFFTVISKYLTKAGYEKIHNTKGEGGSLNSGYILSDGTQIVAMWLSPSNCSDANPTSNCGDFYIKTDNKPYYDDDGNIRPNLFAFFLKPNKIEPLGIDDTNFKNYCLNGRNYSRCTGWVIMNGNMDYLHCNDLSINGKTKCK